MPRMRYLPTLLIMREETECGLVVYAWIILRDFYLHHEGVGKKRCVAYTRFVKPLYQFHTANASYMIYHPIFCRQPSHVRTHNLHINVLSGIHALLQASPFIEKPTVTPSQKNLICRV